MLHGVPLVVSWGLYGTRLEVVTHCWLVSLVGKPNIYCDCFPQAFEANAWLILQC